MNFDSPLDAGGNTLVPSTTDTPLLHVNDCDSHNSQKQKDMIVTQSPSLTDNLAIFNSGISVSDVPCENDPTSDENNPASDKNSYDESEIDVSVDKEDLKFMNQNLFGIHIS
ncbi:hypothetical protein JTB14_004499 [Gonioctena quinquepunctata]|nr:hypothetical protein JTB14_004499 [Gonioctena quinquepunctata]